MPPDARPPDEPVSSVEEFLSWARSAPDGTTIPVNTVLGLLEATVKDTPSPDTESQVSPVSDTFTWRERLWIVPAQTRLGTEELAEALGRSTDWIYKRTQSAAQNPIPHARLDGSLVFKAGEIRSWLREHEVVEFAVPMESSPPDRSIRLLEPTPSD